MGKSRQSKRAQPASSVMEKFKRSRAAPAIMDSLGDPGLTHLHRRLHDESGPYTHALFDPLCDDATMRKIHNEVTTNLTATLKETDLFKVYQTGDLGNLREDEPLAIRMPELMQLRRRIYSAEFRKFVQDITGCRELTDRTDCSTNAYAEGCHLMCHDDVIGTRCISYIIYLTDPDEPWTEEDGGALELYPLDGDDTSHDRQGVPAPVPTHNILPKFNTMALFAVQPGRSYHAVQEVYASGKPRLSISGWYHAATAPVGSDLASLRQIMSQTRNDQQFIPISADIFGDIDKFEAARDPADEDIDDNTEDVSEVEVSALSDADMFSLRPFLNPTYLNLQNMKMIRASFNRDSSIQLQSFLKKDLGASIINAAVNADTADSLGAQFSPPLDYSVGVGGGWKQLGPPHLRRYLRFEALNSGEFVGAAVGDLMFYVREKLFRSPAFHRYLYIITGVKPTSSRDEIRRFRPGLDYTVAHYGTMVDNNPSLDATLCFTNRGDETDAENWESGDVGGFECYMAADDDADADATAEVYKVENDDDDGELISVSAGDNVLNLILREQKVMRFIKYVSHKAAGGRWDISAEFETAINS